MKKILKKLVLGAMVGLLTFSAAGCGSSSGDTNTLKVGVTNFADSLDPTENFFSWVVMRYGIGESLTKFDDKMNIQPWLADSWSVSDDHLTWTFHINDKAVFSNGNPVTAESVKASIERVFDKSNRAKTFFVPMSIVADGQDLKITTAKPVPSLPGMLADPLFLVIDTSVDRDLAKEGPIGTGPYMVESYTKEKAILVANPNYWNGTVPFKRLEIPTIDDPNTRAMALQSGEVDMAVNIAPSDLSLFSNTNDYTKSEIASLRTVLAQMNMAPNRILQDIRVRQALLSSLDKETYNTDLLGGNFITGKAPVPPSLDYGFEDLIDPNQYNVERSKQLLAEAGWKDTDGDGILDKDGQPLKLDFVYYSGRAELPTYAEAVQADAKKVGIDIELHNVDYNILDGMRQKGDFDLIISNILVATTGDPEIYLSWYWKTNVNGSNPQNGTGYSNPEFDALADRLSVTFDPQERRQIMIQMQQIILNDAGALFLGYPKTNIVSHSYLTGATMLPADYYWVTNQISHK